jgi:hypothetical protein
MEALLLQQPQQAQHRRRQQQQPRQHCRYAYHAAILCLIALAQSAVQTCQAAAPIAPHLVLVAETNKELLISLPGYDSDGDELTATISQLPDSGTLNQLSQVFSDHGYEPKRGTAVQANSVVTGSKNRIVFTPPQNLLAPTGKWTHFTYTVNDGSTTSNTGIVTLVSGDKATVGSTFTTGLEGWTTVSNGNGGVGSTYEQSSRGSLSYYMYSTDDEINVDKTTGDDLMQWYFKAPAKFLGKQQINYGGKLEFHMAASSGDFSTKNMNSQLDLVYLECATCNQGNGITLVRRLDSTLTFDGKPKTFSLTLDEKPQSGWLKDPKNTLLTWNSPSQCEFIEVLNALSGIRILGDFTRWYESVDIDNIHLVAGRKIPISCYSSMD